MDDDINPNDMIGTPEGMEMFLVHFVLSHKGEDYKDETAYVNVETLDLEEVFHTVQEDMSIQFTIEEFVNDNYGELVFDSFRPVLIQQWALKEDGLIDRDIDPPVVWTDESYRWNNETTH